MASFYFNKIELEHECEPNLQIYDSVSISEFMLTPVSLPDLDSISIPTLIPVPINLKHEPLVLDSYIPVLGKECESQFFDLDSTFEHK